MMQMHCEWQTRETFHPCMLHAHSILLSEEMEEGVEEEVGIGDTNMLEIVLVELVGIFCAIVILNMSSHCLCQT